MHGTLLDGTPYDGADELPAELLDHKDQFARCLTEYLLVYALGRGLEQSDRSVVTGICSCIEKKGYGLATLLDQVVLSDLFKDK